MCEHRRGNKVHRSLEYLKIFTVSFPMKKIQAF